MSPPANHVSQPLFVIILLVIVFYLPIVRLLAEPLTTTTTSTTTSSNSHSKPPPPPSAASATSRCELKYQPAAAAATSAAAVDSCVDDYEYLQCLLKEALDSLLPLMQHSELHHTNGPDSSDGFTRNSAAKPSASPLSFLFAPSSQKFCEAFVLKGFCVSQPTEMAVYCCRTFSRLCSATAGPVVGSTSRPLPWDVDQILYDDDDDDQDDAGAGAAAAGHDAGGSLSVNESASVDNRSFVEGMATAGTESPSHTGGLVDDATLKDASLLSVSVSKGNEGLCDFIDSAIEASSTAAKAFSQNFAFMLDGEYEEAAAAAAGSSSSSSEGGDQQRPPRLAAEQPAKMDGFPSAPAADGEAVATADGGKSGRSNYSTFDDGEFQYDPAGHPSLDSVPAVHSDLNSVPAVTSDRDSVPAVTSDSVPVEVKSAEGVEANLDYDDESPVPPPLHLSPEESGEAEAAETDHLTSAPSNRRRHSRASTRERGVGGAGRAGRAHRRNRDLQQVEVEVSTGPGQQQNSQTSIIADDNDAGDANADTDDDNWNDENSSSAREEGDFVGDFVPLLGGVAGSSVSTDAAEVAEAAAAVESAEENEVFGLLSLMTTEASSLLADLMPGVDLKAVNYTGVEEAVAKRYGKEIIAILEKCNGCLKPILESVLGGAFETDAVTAETATVPAESADDGGRRKGGKIPSLIQMTSGEFAIAAVKMLKYFIQQLEVEYDSWLLHRDSPTGRTADGSVAGPSGGGPGPASVPAVLSMEEFLQHSLAALKSLVKNVPLKGIRENLFSILRLVSRNLNDREKSVLYEARAKQLYTDVFRCERELPALFYSSQFGSSSSSNSEGNQTSSSEQVSREQRSSEATIDGENQTRGENVNYVSVAVAAPAVAAPAVAVAVAAPAVAVESSVTNAEEVKTEEGVSSLPSSLSISPGGGGAASESSLLSSELNNIIGDSNSNNEVEQQRTVAAATASADTASADTASADTASADTASADTASADTASADTASADAASTADDDDDDNQVDQTQSSTNLRLLLLDADSGEAERNRKALRKFERILRRLQESGGSTGPVSVSSDEATSVSSDGLMAGLDLPKVVNFVPDLQRIVPTAEPPIPGSTSTLIADATSDHPFILAVERNSGGDADDASLQLLSGQPCVDVPEEFVAALRRLYLNLDCAELFTAVGCDPERFLLPVGAVAEACRFTWKRQCGTVLSVGAGPVTSSVVAGLAIPESERWKSEVSDVLNKYGCFSNEPTSTAAPAALPPSSPSAGFDCSVWSSSRLSVTVLFCLSLYFLYLID